MQEQQPNFDSAQPGLVSPTPSVCVAAVTGRKSLPHPHFQADPSVSQTGAAHNQLALRRETTLRQACPLECQGAQCAFKDSMLHGSCNSHYVSQFAAFFIDARTKRSVVESFDSCVCRSYLVSPPHVLFVSAPGKETQAETKRVIEHSTVCVSKSREAQAGTAPQAHVPVGTVLRSASPLQSASPPRLNFNVVSL